jgi:hypothetical protein
VADDERNEAPHTLEDHFLVYVRDPTLWPVLAVVVLIAGTLGGAVILYSLELRNPFALAALAIIIVASGHALLGQWRQRRFGIPAWIVVGFWLASACIALAARRAGVF